MPGQPSNSIWRDEGLVIRLRQDWAAGHSTLEIGRRLGINKNMIVSKAHRLGLEPRPSPIRAKGAPKPEKAPRHTLPPLPLQVFAEVPRPVFAAPAPPPPPPYIPRPRQCEWLSGDGPFVQCQHKIARGSYCEGHAAVAYVGRERRDVDGWVARHHSGVAP